VLEISDKFLKDFQDTMLQRARDNLRGDGFLHPWVIALVSPRLVADLDIQQKLRPMNDFKKDMRDVPTDTLAMVIAPGHYTEELAFDFIMRQLPPDKRDYMTLMLTMTEGPKLTAEAQREMFCRGFLKVKGLHEKDLYAAWLKDFLTRTHALAFLKVDDTWVLKTSTPEAARKHTGNLADNPDATEAIIVSMETKQFARIVAMPYEREARGEGPVKSFGEWFEYPTQMFEGRFTNLLQRDADLPKEQRS
jgi:hypothetical protein